MRVITIARKPLIGSVAENVSKYGTGGLNIDGCRIGRNPDDLPGWYKSGADGTKGYRGESTFRIHAMSAVEVQERCGSKGRWSANLILEHHHECHQVGTKRVRGRNAIQGGNKIGDGGQFGTLIYGNSKGRHEITPRGYADEDGLEEVSVWDCHPECPVAELDRQHRFAEILCYSDKGGASRFFKQVKGVYRI